MFSTTTMVSFLCLFIFSVSSRRHHAHRVTKFVTCEDVGSTIGMDTIQLCIKCVQTNFDEAGNFCIFDLYGFESGTSCSETSESTEFTTFEARTKEECQKLPIPPTQPTTTTAPTTTTRAPITTTPGTTTRAPITTAPATTTRAPITTTTTTTSPPPTTSSTTTLAPPTNMTTTPSSGGSIIAFSLSMNFTLSVKNC